MRQRPIPGARGPLPVIPRPGEVIPRPVEVIPRPRQSSRAPLRSSPRPLRLRSGHRTVLPRPISRRIGRLPIGRGSVGVDSSKQAVGRRAPPLVRGDEEVIRCPRRGRSVPIPTGIVTGMIPSGEMTSRGRRMIGTGKGRLARGVGIRPGRVETSPGGFAVRSGRLRAGRGRLPKRGGRREEEARDRMMSPRSQ